MAHICMSRGMSDALSMSHATHTNESWHIYGWVMAHICMSRGMSDALSMSRVAYHECVMSHTMNETCHTRTRHVTHVKTLHIASFIRVPWLIHMCAMTHLYMCPDSFVCVPHLISHVYISIYPYVVGWLREGFYVCHDSFIHVPWLIHMCAMTHLYICPDSFGCARAFETRLDIKVNHVTHYNESCLAHEWVMSHT